MHKLMAALVRSSPLQILTTLLVYSLFSALIGISLIPSLYILHLSWTIGLGFQSQLASIILLSFACGAAVFLYFITGSLVMGISIRLISLGIKPGQYNLASITVLRWMIYNGIYHIAGMTILAYTPMSFIGVIFCKLMGAKIGKNVRLNTWFLNDAYLLEIEDNVVIGGKTDVSCHTVENGKLFLYPIKIGANTLIGQHCYISPGVTIGANCIIGQYAFIRKNTTIPDKSIIGAISGLPIRAVAKFEREARENFCEHKEERNVR